MSRKTLIKMLTVTLTIALILSVQVFAAEITVTGTINDMYQVVTDTGEIYEVADNDMGSEMLDFMGQTVKITGTLIEGDGGIKTILVNQYEIIEKE